MPLVGVVQEVFTIATFEGLFTPMRELQGVLNATTYFQGVTTKFLAGLNCKVWVHDIVWWGADEDDSLNILGKILGRLEDAGLFAASHKVFFLRYGDLVV